MKYLLMPLNILKTADFAMIKITEATEFDLYGEPV
jgi:hypothetical protein